MMTLINQSFLTRARAGLVRVETQLFAKSDPHARVSQNVRRYRTHNASLGERTPLSGGLRPPNFNVYVELGN